MFSNSKTELIPVVQDDEFLPPISYWTNFGGLFILGTLGLAIFAASFAKYKETVKANAVIRPAGELRIVQSSSEGQVKQIWVRENQTVKKGDMIATIDDSRLQTKRSQLQANIQQAKLQLAQINAQISSLNKQIKFETNRINRVIASAQAEFKSRNRQYQDKQITTVAERQEADANIKIAQSELQAAQAQLKSVQANLMATEAALGVAKSKESRYAKAAKVGALSQDQLEEAQLAVKQQEKAVEVQKASVEGQIKTIARLQQAMVAAIARQKRVIVALNPSNAEVEIAQERIAQETASREANKANLNKELQALIKQQIEIQKQLEREQSENKQVEIELNKAIVRATDDGIIFKINLRNPGQTVRNGEEIVQIVPSNASLIVKAAIASEDKNKVAVGQKVVMRISACPYPDYGTLQGQIKTISPDLVLQSPNNNSSTLTTNANQNISPNPGFFEVTIKPKTFSLNKGKQKCLIQLGMKGTADIISQEETVIQFLLRKARLSTSL